MTETIRLDFPYDFERVMDRLSMDPLISLSKEERYVMVPTDERKIYKVEAFGTTDEPKFNIVGPNDEKQIQKIKEIFHFDRSLEPVHEHFAATNLASIFEEHRGTPIIREFSLYATLMRSIIHQQLNLSFAHTLTTRFVHTFGEQVEGVWIYPEPARYERILERSAASPSTNCPIVC